MLAFVPVQEADMPFRTFARFVFCSCSALSGVLLSCASGDPEAVNSAGTDDDDDDNGGTGGRDIPDARAPGPDDVSDEGSADTQDAADADLEDTDADALSDADAAQPSDAADGDTSPVDTVVTPDTRGDTSACLGKGCVCTPATAASVCGGLACVDGYCCDAACSGTCQTCALAGSEGTCRFIAAGQDPALECAEQPASTCGTNGTCNGAGACAFYPASTPCNDGQACSTGDSCDGAGTCRGTVAGTCGPGAGNECCAGTCVDGAGCTTVAGACNDSCTNQRLDVGGTCSGCGPPGAVGTCQGRTSYRCDATVNLMCQQVTCGGIAYQCTNAGGTWAWRPGGACDDGKLCTHSDTCTAGTCSGTDVTCTSTPCSTSTCNGTASCTVTARTGETCNDGNACTSNDVCNASGVCQAGLTTTCTSTPCVSRTCDGAGGCLETIRSGATCEDGDLCTWADTCDGAGVCQRGTPVNCSGLDTSCATFSCNGTSSCAAAPRNVGGTCDDGNAATSFDTCSAAGTCQGDVGCPPPAEACVTGTQNRRGCGGARTISRTVAGAGGAVINDNTCSARNDLDNDGSCFDAGNDHTYRLYMRQGETLTARMQEFSGCVTSDWDGTLKIFETAGCSNTGCTTRVFCDDYISGRTANYTAARDGWVIIIADGSTAFDDEGTYRLTVNLTCRSGNCACL